MTNKIAILYICTGKYTIFWEDFYNSCEKYFVQNSERHYFIFTDSKSIRYSNESANIHLVHQEKLGWPFDTLFRFKMFNKISEQLQNFDYTFFFNSNMVFLKEVNESILPNSQEKLLVVKHPGFFNKKRAEFTYETNPNSLAFIPNSKGIYYFMGGFNGGISKDYLKLIKQLEINIDIDYNKGIIALWHDESHLNKYFIDKTPKILLPSFGYPEDANLPFEKNIIILNKSNFGGHNYLRDIKEDNLIKKIIRKVF